jgi:type IV fimbrial biogenesis protein FimT
LQSYSDGSVGRGGDRKIESGPAHRGKAHFLRDGWWKTKLDGVIMNKIRRNDRGFTLTELMIAVSIIGLIAVLSIPNYSRFMMGWRLNGETQHLASALRTARSSAIMKNIDVVFTFDLDANTYSWFEDMNRNGNRDNGEYESAEYELCENVVITAHTLSSNILTFGSKGNTRESGSITLRNTLNNVKSVRIFGGTGNVTVD